MQNNFSFFIDPESHEDIVKQSIWNGNPNGSRDNANDMGKIEA